MTLRQTVAVKPLNSLNIGLLQNPAIAKGEAPRRPVIDVPVPASIPQVFAMEEDNDLDAFDDKHLEPSLFDRITGMFDAHSHLEASLHRNVHHASNAANGRLDILADTLSRLGYSVKVTSSAAAAGQCQGSFYSLRHKFIVLHLVNEEYIIDPAFKEHFLVHNPTKRFAKILALVPSVAIAPQRRLLRTVTFLSMEMERCFSARRVALPPWRKLRSLLSKWEGANEGALPALARDREEVAAAPRKIAGDKFDVCALPVYIGFHIATERNECVCCGLKVPGARPQLIKRMTTRPGDRRRGRSAPAA